MIDLPRSTYYYSPRGGKRGQANVELARRIESIQGSLPRYGYRRVTRELSKQGITVNHKRVARVMREHGLAIKGR